MKPTLLANRRLPISELEPHAFEQFVTAVLGKIGPAQGFRDVVKTSGPTDNGFDAQARRIADGKLLAIQCKRYAADLTVATAAFELAKVALQSAIEGSEISEHWFISSGKVAKKLESALRETSRNLLVQEAVHDALHHEELKKKRELAFERGIEIEKRVDLYARGVRISAWSGEQLDIMCTAAWSQLVDIIDRFFAVERLVFEQPRPDFDEEKHLRALQALPSHFIALRATGGGALPPGLRSVSAADPLAQPMAETPPAQGDNGEVDDLLRLLAHPPPGRFVMLVGDGGSGKTTTLHMAAAVAATERQNDKDAPLPLLVPLQAYRGDLDRLIQEECALTRGHWRALPGEVVLFADGLNEVPAGFEGTLATDLRHFLQNGRSLVLSVRSAGLRRALVLPGPGEALRLQPLSRRQGIGMVSKVLPGERASELVSQLRARQRSRRFRLTELPFGLALAIAHFRKAGSLPADDASFVDKLLSARFDRDRELAGEELPEELLRRLSEDVAFRMRIERQVAALSKNEAVEAVASAVAAARLDAIFGSEDLTPMRAWGWVREHEILVPSGDERWYCFRHDLVADFLAAGKLARRWRDHLEQLRRSSISDDAFIFAARKVPEAERVEYLRCVAEVDLSLAADCSVEMGSVAEHEVLQLIEAEWVRPQQLSAARADTAASRLQIVEASTWLRSKLRGHEFEAALHDSRLYPCVRALSARGDEQLLQAILPEAERMMAVSVKCSGGELSLWEAAPAPTRLALARDWLAPHAGAADVILSIRTLGELGDDSDLPLLRSVLEQSSHLGAVVDAFWGLCELGARSDAVRLLRAREGCDTYVRAKLARVLAGADEAVDCMALVDGLVEPISDDGKALSPEKACFARLSVVGALNALTLAPAIVKRFLDLYQRCPELRSFVWQIVAHHGFPEFEPLAENAVDAGSPVEVGYASNFAHQRPLTAPFRALFAKKLRSRIQSDVAMSRETWGLVRALTFLATEDPEAIAPIIADKLRDLLRCYREVRNGSPTAFAWGGRNLLEGVPQQHWEIHLRMLVQNFVEPAREVAGYLPLDCRLALLHVNLSTLPETEKEDVRHILRSCETSLIDAQLSTIDEPSAQISTLCLIAPLGTSPARLTLLLSHLETGLRHLASAHALARVVSAFWCDELADALAAAVAREDFSEESFEYGRAILEVAMSQTTAEIGERIVQPHVAHARSPLGRRILETWVEASAMVRR